MFTYIPFSLVILALLSAWSNYWLSAIQANLLFCRLASRRNPPIPATWLVPRVCGFLLSCLPTRQESLATSLTSLFVVCEWAKTQKKKNKNVIHQPRLVCFGRNCPVEYCPQLGRGAQAKKHLVSFLSLKEIVGKYGLRDSELKIYQMATKLGG